MQSYIRISKNKVHATEQSGRKLHSLLPDLALRARESEVDLSEREIFCVLPTAVITVAPPNSEASGGK